jgi:site-specific DNA-methyltransferase (adenine-specific)
MKARIVNDDFVNVANGLEAGVVDLVFADPPYFETKGKFDFVWESFADYLIDVRRWAEAIKRILKPTGAVLWYGHALKIAYSQIVFEELGFDLLNHIAWEKIDGQCRKNSPDEQRRFPPVKEHILYFEREREIENPLLSVKNDPSNFKGLRQYARNFLKETGRSKADLIKRVGQSCDHFFRFDSRQWGLPTEETYNLLYHYIPLGSKFLIRSLEDLKSEYDGELNSLEAQVKNRHETRRPFTSLGLTDVLKYSQESHITKKYGHDTGKPPTMTRALIEATTRPNDLIFVPFGGSGTEAAEAVKAGRRVIVCEIDGSHYNTILKRLGETNKEDLFLSTNTLFQL